MTDNSTSINISSTMIKVKVKKYKKNPVKNIEVMELPEEKEILSIIENINNEEYDKNTNAKYYNNSFAHIPVVSKEHYGFPKYANNQAIDRCDYNISTDLNNYQLSDNVLNTNQKTKKKKTSITKEEKDKMWKIIENEKNNKLKNTEVECIYDDTTEHDICSLCNSVLIIMEDGFPTCTNIQCGVIHKEVLDYSPEWRFYGADDKNTNDPTRCGNPINPLLLESSYGCKILCNAKSSYEMKKIRKWTEWQSMPHKEKSLYEEFQFITIMAQNAGIPKIFIDDAMIIHKDISEQKMFRGLNRDGIKSASIYISCRLNGCPRTAHEISEIFRLDKTSATTGCSTAVNILHNIERNINPEHQADLQTTTPSSFIERYCSKLNINSELTMLAMFVTKKVENNSIILDNTPHAIAAGIVFLISHVCNLNISKLDIKKICGVSEVTINKCFKKLYNLQEDLIPMCILQKYK